LEIAVRIHAVAQIKRLDAAEGSDQLRVSVKNLLIRRSDLPCGYDVHTVQIHESMGLKPMLTPDPIAHLGGCRQAAQAAAGCSTMAASASSAHSLPLFSRMGKRGVISGMLL